MDSLDLGDVVLHVRAEGPEHAPTVVFANSLGTDFRLWDQVIARLPSGLRLLRYDKRGAWPVIRAKRPLHDGHAGCGTPNRCARRLASKTVCLWGCRLAG